MQKNRSTIHKSSTKCKTIIKIINDFTSCFDKANSYISYFLYINSSKQPQLLSAFGYNFSLF